MVSHDWSFLYKDTSAYVAVLKPNAALSLVLTYLHLIGIYKQEYIACLVTVKLEFCTEKNLTFMDVQEEKVCLIL
jgi:hypothetical protein